MEKILQNRFSRFLLQRGGLNKCPGLVHAFSTANFLQWLL